MAAFTREKCVILGKKIAARRPGVFDGESGIDIKDEETHGHR
jgi:hypothetical protein